MAPLSAVTEVRLRTQLEVVPLITAGIDPAALAQRPPSGKWSALENLAHLGRVHEVYLERLERIRTEDRPLLERYQAEEDAAWPRWAALPADRVLAELADLRATLNARVASLSAADLARVGVHGRLGPLPVALWLEFFLLHEAHHLYTVLLLVPRR